MTTKQFWRVAVAALVLGLAHSADAAEIKVLCIPGLKAAVNAMLPAFEKGSGDTVSMTYEIYAGQKSRIESGDFDVAIFAKGQIAEMQKLGRVVPGSNVDAVSTSIGVAVKSGASKPDISSEEAFKRALLAAKSITYTGKSSTGVYITKLLDRLGLTEKLKDKLILQSGGAMTAPAVAKGQAELALVLVSDILATPGVDLVGPLPAAVQHSVMQTAALGTKAQQSKVGVAFIKFLSSPTAKSFFKAKGLDPAQS
jgi:molybdate transport system substrate-binding protein